MITRLICGLALSTFLMVGISTTASACRWCHRDHARWHRYGYGAAAPAPRFGSPAPTAGSAATSTTMRQGTGDVLGAPGTPGPADSAPTPGSGERLGGSLGSQQESAGLAGLAGLAAKKPLLVGLVRMLSDVATQDDQTQILKLIHDVVARDLDQTPSAGAAVDTDFQNRLQVLEQKMSEVRRQLQLEPDRVGDDIKALLRKQSKLIESLDARLKALEDKQGPEADNG